LLLDWVAVWGCRRGVVTNNGGGRMRWDGVVWGLGGFSEKRAWDVWRITGRDRRVDGWAGE